MKRRSFIAGMLAAPIAAQLPASSLAHLEGAEIVALADGVAYTHRAVSVGYITMADLSVLDALRCRVSDDMLEALGCNVFAEPVDAR